MKLVLVSLVGAMMLLSHAQADDRKDEGRYLAKPLKGDYYIYGGSLGDSIPPTKKDRKLSLMFVGPLAKDLFDHIGPDAKNGCSSDPDYRERNRGDLSCIWTKQDGYSCYVGLDVRSGKSILGSVC